MPKTTTHRQQLWFSGIPWNLGSLNRQATAVTPQEIQAPTMAFQLESPPNYKAMEGPPHHKDMLAPARTPCLPSPGPTQAGTNHGAFTADPSQSDDDGQQQQVLGISHLLSGWYPARRQLCATPVIAVCYHKASINNPTNLLTGWPQPGCLGQQVPAPSPV